MRGRPCEILAIIDIFPFLGRIRLVQKIAKGARITINGTTAADAARSQNENYLRCSAIGSLIWVQIP
jgi:hypothetical protein